jgi:hypothetical protein
MKTISRQDFHRKIYLSGLALLVCCLPLSRYVLSLSQFLLIFNWLAEGGFGNKFRLLRRRPDVLVFISIMLIYMAGMLYTSNIPAGLIKVRNVLPIAVLPVIIVTSQPLDRKTGNRLLLIFTLAVSVAAMICLVAYLLNPGASNRDFRKISLFIPHIRFALLIIMAILILLYQVFFKPFPSKKVIQVFCFLVAFLLAAFLFVLRSFAGIIIMFISITLFVIRASLLSQGKYTRYIIISLVIAFYFLVIFTIAYVGITNFHASPVNPATLDTRTVNGRAYENNFTDRILENGHYVDLYVCEPELRKEWNTRSKISYDGLDFKGQRIQYTLRRYLTSKGLRKDSAALSQLTTDEILAIEKGRANYLFSTRPGLYQRLYETLWEIHMWHRTGFVRYHSFGQRIVFLQTAGKVIRKNFWTGVGTGDVYDHMLKTTGNNHEAIEQRWKGEPHNQYAFFLMAFGIFGFIWIMVSCIGPALFNRSYRYLLFNLFTAIMLISMTVLDTIESYDNMVFFVFFYSLFVFNYGHPQKNT